MKTTRLLRHAFIACSIFAASLILSSHAKASQNSTTIQTTGNLSGLQLVNGINDAIDTIATMYSGSSSPGAVGAFRWWADTGTNTLWQRNAANTAWVKIGPLLTELATTSASSLTSGTVATARLPAASTSVAGIAQLNSTTTSTSTTQAATASAVKAAYDAAVAAQTSATNAISYAARAFCVFNGAASGTFGCTRSRNFTSITKTATGWYTANMSIMLSTSSYALAVSNSGDGNCKVSPASVQNITILCATSAGNQIDPTYLSIIVFDL